MSHRPALVTLAATVLVLTACSGETDSEGAATAGGSSSPTSAPPTSDPSTTSAPTQTPAPAPEPAPTPAPKPAPDASVPGLAESKLTGDRLRLGAVREETAAFTSYDVTYRSSRTTSRGRTTRYTISGVLNVPNGRGPFPAVVLAHGYIDPAVYERGQGMTRERGYLAERGYVAFHVDYRNHAESDDAPDGETDARLGYAIDTVNAVHALQATRDVPVADDRIALFGRSMGGGVVQKALIAAPGLVRAAAPWASVSSLEAENYEQFNADDPTDGARNAAIVERFGLPRDNPRTWRQNSSRPYFDRITEPVLLVHGTNDDTCPPRWADATQRALREAGVDSRLSTYDDGHAFGPAFFEAMDDTIAFFKEQGV